MDRPIAQRLGARDVAIDVFLALAGALGSIGSELLGTTSAALGNSGTTCPTIIIDACFFPACRVPHLPQFFPALDGVGALLNFSRWQKLDNDQARTHQRKIAFTPVSALYAGR